MSAVDEVQVNRWIMRYLNQTLKLFTSDEISVSEACGPCLRKSFYMRTRGQHLSPSEFLKLVGNEVHLTLQDVLRSDGWDVEVSVSIKVNDFTLRGRADAVKDDMVLEFKTTTELPDTPYDSHVLQIQAYLTMLRASRGFLIYISRGNGRVRVFRISPHKQALKQVVERAKQLHESLRTNRPPPATKGPWCGYCSFRLGCG